MEPEDLFVMDVTGETQLAAPPAHKGFTPSQCTPLFYNAYKMRGAGAVIHTHSQHAVMATLLYEKEFRITHQEMIKGIKKGWGPNAKVRHTGTRLSPRRAASHTHEHTDTPRRLERGA